MPTSPSTRCTYPGCSTLVPHGRCAEHQPPPWRHRSQHQPGNPRRWRQLRARILRRDHEVCHWCGQPGADQVDHLVSLAHGGARWDEGNLAAIHDDPCHRAKTRAEQQHGG